jgi:AP endonuclease-2
MLPWIKHGDIQPSLNGSDHCPIFIDLHDEIVTSAGEKLTLREVMPTDGDRDEPPRLAARRWDEFSGKQTLLSSFFAKGGKTTTTSIDSQAPGLLRPSSSQVPAILSITVPKIADAVLTDLARDSSPPDACELRPFLTSTSNSKSSTPSDGKDLEQKSLSPPSVPPKRKAIDPPLVKANKMQKKGSGPTGQRTLAAFFAQPPSLLQTSKVTSDPPSSDVDPADCLHADYQLALRFSASQDLDTPSQSSSSSASSGSKAAWSQLMAPVQPPKCIIHGELTKEYTVNKPGPNKGKAFFICSRCVPFRTSPSPTHADLINASLSQTCRTWLRQGQRGTAA